MSTLQFLVGALEWLQALLRPVIPWLSTLGGRAFLMVAGLAWLSAIAWGPEQTDKSVRDPEELNEFDIRVLRLLCLGMRRYRVEEISAVFEVPDQKAQHHINRLMGTGNATQAFHEGGLPLFEITAAGRDFLLKEGLLF